MTDGEAGPDRSMRWQPSVLRLAGAFAVLAAVAVLVVPATPAAEYTDSWTTAGVALLALAATLFSAAAATASATTSETSAQAARRSAEAGQESAQAARRAYGQQLYELARAAHADLTTGEVAAARDRLGNLARDRQRLWRAGGPPDAEFWGNVVVVLGRGRETAQETMEQYRRDWFTLLWCFQRIEAIHRLLTAAPVEAGEQGPGPRVFLEELVCDQLRFLDEEAVHSRAGLEEFFQEPVDDAQSARSFRTLATLLVDTGPTRWADRLTTQVGEVVSWIVLHSADKLTFPLGRLTDTQFLALHQVLTSGETGAYMSQRAELSNRMREQAWTANNNGDAETARILQTRAEAIAGSLPSTPDRPAP